MATEAMSTFSRSQYWPFVRESTGRDSLHNGPVIWTACRKSKPLPKIKAIFAAGIMHQWVNDCLLRYQSELEQEEEVTWDPGKVLPTWSWGLSGHSSKNVLYVMTWRLFLTLDMSIPYNAGMSHVATTDTCTSARISPRKPENAPFLKEKFAFWLKFH